MSILDKIEIVCGDVRDVTADVLVLKYADGLYGADLAVADRLSIDMHVVQGQTKFFEGALRPIPGRVFNAGWVMYRGVGDLFKFRYHEIRQFAYATLVNVVEKFAGTRGVMASTIHGPGYGLDEREAFASQLAGYLDLADYETHVVKKLLIVELDEARVERLQRVLDEYKRLERKNTETLEDFSSLLEKDFGTKVTASPEPSAPSNARKPVGLLSKDPFADSAPPPAPPPVAPEKPKLFAAMPFAEKYMDEYDIAFVEAAHAHGFICERLDLEHYVGDVIDEIFQRIRDSAGVVALLNDNNPNVFLEVGYAMALSKPVILVAHEDQDIAFDLRGQRRQTYSRIAELRREMTALIGDLKADRVLP